MASGWLARVQGLRQALVELWSAEIEALRADLRGSATELKRGMVLVAAAAFFGFWTVATLVYFSIELLALWLPRWGAVGVSAGVFALVTVIFVLLARARLEPIENPVDTVTKRIESHRAWLRDEVLPGPEQE